MKWPKLPRIRLTAGTAELAAFAAGLLLFCAGLSLWYFPAGLIGGGGVLMAVALFGDKSA